ncbi:DUF397 domain-containing protein [Streptomyces sp. NBC_01236]|uniref:DUF397 domain-containing protein n=1 Tax=Streptomyces sp. NBC_01236 TaxID=2903789 RepID=UPI002E0FD248|nr:DUF397 domain-containing protein [Streptomyces sp. NBC_01236]
MPEPLAPLWFKSSYSGGSGTECVECSRTDEGALLRDSKVSTGPVITVGSHAWQSFIRHLDQQVRRI